MHLRQINIGLAAVAIVLFIILIFPVIKNLVGMAYYDVSTLEPSCELVQEETAQKVDSDR